MNAEDRMVAKHTADEKENPMLAKMRQAIMKINETSPSIGAVLTAKQENDSNEYVAGKLGISVGTVKKRYSEGLKLLREVMAEEDVKEGPANMEQAA
jgi:DNA-directed RNA polymerase specialized sigma24 family protein